jgi:hypothetical protein
MTARPAQSNVVWEPQEGPQKLFVQCPAFECLFGGAIGGGKSDGLLGDFSRGLGTGPAWKGVYFRRFFPDMDSVIRRSMEIFGPIYGSKCFSQSKYEWNFPGGELLQFRAMEKDNDVYKYQGQDYTWAGFDELTQWASPFPYTYMMSRLRSAKGVHVRMRAASNPGGPGHQWVKARFIDPAPPGTGVKVETRSGREYWRVFIPSKLEDNKILMESDPGYADRIYEVSDPILAEALRKGRWDIVAGAAFSEFDPEVHIIDPAPMPTDRPIWRSLDWGYKEPYGGLWGFPDDGDLVIGHELYGWSGKPNVGTEEAPSEVRKKIENFEAMSGLYVPIGWLDNQCWEQKGQTGLIAEELGGRQLGWRPWVKGPNSRIHQKQMIHELLSVTNGRARIKIMRNCRHLIRTLPILPTAENNREDVDTKAEDHLYDALRGLVAKNVPTREQIRKRQMRRRMENMEFVSASDLRYGGF